MSLSALSSRAIIGEFYRALEQDMGQRWVPGVSMLFQSDQESETYKWLGQTPALREWVGGRHAKGLRDNGITIENLEFEATLDIARKDLVRDKTSQIMLRVNELARRTNAHWASLLSTLVSNGESTVCYDGQYFFDTDHAEGDSGTQSNDLSVDISTLPTSVHGSTTAPAAEEMQLAILQAAQQIIGFKDDQGEPMNEDAMPFLVMVPVPFFQSAATAVGVPQLSSGQTNVIQTMDGFRFQVAPNARLTWTDKFAVFRTDSNTKAFIRQEEEPVTLSAKAEGSEYEHDTDRHQYGVKASRNVGYGFWQDACLATLI